MRVRELYLHTSNRIESLAERLVEVSLQQPLPGLLEQETVMTLNPGMARWLRFEISQKLGVSFAWDFPFPGKLFQQLLSGLDPRHLETGLFDENLARWELFDLLEQLEDRPDFALLKRYCEPGGSRRLQLASKLAWLFDQYLLYRPDAITDWESGKNGDHWQAEIWRRLVKRLFPDKRRPAHIARIWRDLSASHPDHLKPDTEDWPSRISVFGVSSLPPLYLDALDVVARFRPVHIYLLQPSDLYWADLKSKKQIARASQRKTLSSSGDDFSIDESSFDLGNPLLPSFGQQGQAFLDLVLDKDPIHDDGAFCEPDPSTQLGCMQADLFLLENRSADATPQHPFPKFDGTLQIHRSVGARREVESLWDYLVDHFSLNPGASASDILVMAPDIQDYAGHIDSVFSNNDESAPSIPYSIADQTGPQESSFISGAIEFLELARKRATALELIELLRHPITQIAFGFFESDIERIEYWIRETRVVWGWDQAHRAQFSAFPTDRNTWQEFRTRLSAGFAFRESELLLPGDVSPYCEIEGESVELAGKLLELVGVLEELHHDSRRSETIAFWNQRLCAVLDRLRPSEEVELNRFYSAIEAIQESLPEESQVIASGQEAMSCAVKALENAAPASGYLSGRVTFCSLKPMRSIPAKVVCLLGMDNDAFPRKSVRAPFDLLTQSPRRGDRNTREEDKQFFLETLLSARDRLFISYKGLSPVSETVREPSIVVSELIDYLEKADPKVKRSDRIVTHRRQPYDPEYFSKKELFTYSKERAENCQTFLNRAVLNEEKADPFPIESALPESERIDVPLHSFIAFFKNPQSYFVKNVIGARFIDPEEAPTEYDPLQQDPLDKYRLRERFAEAIQNNLPIDAIEPSLIASLKLLPPGYMERLSYEKLKEQAVRVESSRAEIASPIPSEIVPIDLECGPCRISGHLTRGRMEDQQFFLHPGKWKAKAYIDIWIQHLLTNTTQPALTTAHSLQEPDKPIKFLPLEDARSILESLSTLYLHGLQQPIPFFPQLSWDALIKAKKQSAEFDEESFLSISRTEFSKDVPNSQYQPKYNWETYSQTCFGKEPPLDSSYAAVSLMIWSPLLQSLETKGVR